MHNTLGIRRIEAWSRIVAIVSKRALPALNWMRVAELLPYRAQNVLLASFLTRLTLRKNLLRQTLTLARPAFLEIF
jgi:hypothetical protein